MAGFEDVPVSTGIVDPSVFLDVDGDGEVKALTDGMLILRFLAGFNGESLIDGVVDADGSRTTAAQIETWLSPFVVAPPAAVATGGLNDSVIVTPQVEDEDDTPQTEVRVTQIQPPASDIDDPIAPTNTDEDTSPRPLY